MVKIAHARFSENGNAVGTAGDQTGKEVSITDWYDGNWTTVYRPIFSSDAAKIAVAARQAALNDYIGYSQKDRTSLYKFAEMAEFDLYKISEKCNCDCSSLVAVCVNAAGIRVSKDMYTGNMDSVLMGTGKFISILSNSVTGNPEMLRPGDIILRSGHTAIVVSAGKESQKSYCTSKTNIFADYINRDFSGLYKATTDVYLRRGASKTYAALAVIPEGLTVRNYGYYSCDEKARTWLYCTYTNTVDKETVVGFICSDYLVKV